MTGDFNTAGEQLVGRVLEREKLGGVEHYKVGQHHAVHVPDDDEADVYSLSYVDVAGHACLILCVFNHDRGGMWEALGIARAGQVTSQEPREIPEGFKLSTAMVEALEAARP